MRDATGDAPTLRRAVDVSATRPVTAPLLADTAVDAAPTIEASHRFARADRAA